MIQFLYFLPLICPIVMGAMMFFMMRGKSTTPSPASTAEELRQLRGEVEQLRTMQGGATATPSASSMELADDAAIGRAGYAMVSGQYDADTMVSAGSTASAMGIVSTPTKPTPVSDLVPQLSGAAGEAERRIRAIAVEPSAPKRASWCGANSQLGEGGSQGEAALAWQEVSSASISVRRAPSSTVAWKAGTNGKLARSDVAA